MRQESNPTNVLTEQDVGALATERERGFDHATKIARLLWAKRQFIFRFTSCGILVSIFIAFAIPKRYTSSARLMPPDSGSNSSIGTVAAMLAKGSLGDSGEGGGGIGNLAEDVLGMKSSSDIFVGILGSRTSEDKLIRQFDLMEVYSDRRMQDARKDLAEHTNVDIDRKSQIIKIEVTDHNPQRAAAMVGGYIDELDNLVASLSSSAARRERIFLGGRLQGVTQDLEVAEKNFSQFASKNTTIDIKEQEKAMVDAAAGLEGQLVAVQSQLEGLKQIYTDNNIRVRSLAARSSELQKKLQELGGKGDDDSSNVASNSDVGMIYPSIRRLPVLGVRYADLYRQVVLQEAIFQTLTKEYEIAKVQEAKEIPTVKVLDPADIPEVKSFPPRLLIIVFGAALTCFFSVVLVLGSAGWDMIDPRDPGKQFATEIWLHVSPGRYFRKQDPIKRRLEGRVLNALGWNNGAKRDHR